jgi:hypothetical protein
MTIESRGLPKAVHTLHTVGERAGDVRPLVDRVRRVYLRSNARHFGSGWAPLAESTVERKQSQRLDSRPEVATGALYRSLTQEKAKGQTKRKKKSEFRFGSRLFYAAWQQGTKTQPKRDLIKLSPADLDEIDRIIEHWISKGHIW